MEVTAQHKTVNRPATARPAASTKIVRRKSGAAAESVHIQASIKVSSPRDPAEREADLTATKIMRMAVPESSVAMVRKGDGRGSVFRQVKKEEKEKKLQTRLESPYLARFAESGVHGIQRKAEGLPDVGPNVAAEIQSSTTSGSPLPLSVRRFMEPRFQADFSKVRIHTGDTPARLNRQLNAQAFTVGSHIFFGRDRFRPETSEGKELIAHELTHTVQQGAAVQRSEDVTINQQSPPMVQRLGISDALDYFADKANNIPGFRMFTIILGVNPINMSRVERSAANILRALIEFIPGGALITQAMDNYGIFDKIGSWVEQQIRTLGVTGSAIKQAIYDFLDSLSWRDIFRLGSVWDRAKRIFTDPIDRIINFAKGIVTGILRFIKEAILRPLAKLAEGTRGYDLLKAILGQDPITGDPVPRNADTLIGGFMKLIGQEEIWSNMKKANAVARAWAWFQGAMGSLLGFVRQIPSLFIRALQSLELVDIVLVPRAFAKVASVFGSFIGSFIRWAGNAVWNLLEIIFSVVAPGAMPYLRKAAGAFRSILKNPIGFVGKLVRAGIAGFRQFAANVGKHLKASLIQWLTGTLGGMGVYIPQSFEIREIIKFVLSVLGLTWQNIRQKLVRVIGETAVKSLETGFDIVVTLVTQGPAAAWEKIREQLSNLKDIVMEEIMAFVTSKIVQSAITKLISMLNPAGAFIQAIIAIYNTIMFFIERLRQIIQVATSFLQSIASIAAGVIAAAAARVEQTMAGLLTLVISFLARFAGLGKVSDAVTNIINKIRGPIDRALDKVVEWIVSAAQKLGKLIGVGGNEAKSPLEKLQSGMEAARAAVRRFADKRVGMLVLKPILAAIRLKYGLAALEAIRTGNNWSIQGTVNPSALVPTDIFVEDEAGEDLTEQELMDMLLGTTAPIRELEAESEPKTGLSESGFSYSMKILIHLLFTSPAPTEQRDQALDALRQKAIVAISSEDSHEIYKALSQAAGRIRGLYKAKESILQIHHEQEVSKHPETFPATALERVRFPKKLQKQLDQKVKEITKKYNALKGKTKAEKRQLAQTDISELRELMRLSILDYKTSRLRDKKGRRTEKGEIFTAPIKPLEEIDLIALPVEAHITVHRQRRLSD